MSEYTHWSEIQMNAVIAMDKELTEIKKIVPKPEGLGELVAGMELIMDANARAQSNKEKVETCIYIAATALRAIGIEVEQ